MTRLEDKIKSLRLQLLIIDLLRHEARELTAMEIGSMLNEEELLDDLGQLELSKIIRWDHELKGWVLMEELEA